MTDSQINALQKVHAALPAEQQNELSRILNSMVAGGFTVNADGKSRQATPAERFVLARVAQHYGLDPLMGQLYLLGGKPYVSYKALYRAAVERGFRVESRPMTPDERAALMLSDEEIAFRASIYRGEERIGVDYGTACESDVGIARGRAGRRVIRSMAQTRAERRVLDKVLGISAHDPSEPPLSATTVDARASSERPRRRLAAIEATPAEERWSAAAAPEPKPDPQPQPSEIVADEEPDADANGQIFPDFE